MGISPPWDAQLLEESHADAGRGRSARRLHGSATTSSSHAKLEQRRRDRAVSHPTRRCVRGHAARLLVRRPGRPRTASCGSDSSVLGSASPARHLPRILQRPRRPKPGVPRHRPHARIVRRWAHRAAGVDARGVRTLRHARHRVLRAALSRQMPSAASRAINARPTVRVYRPLGPALRRCRQRQDERQPCAAGTLHRWDRRSSEGRAGLAPAPAGASTFAKSAGRATTAGRGSEAGRFFARTASLYIHSQRMR